MNPRLSLILKTIAGTCFLIMTLSTTIFVLYKVTHRMYQVIGQVQYHAKGGYYELLGHPSPGTDLPAWVYRENETAKWLFIRVRSSSDVVFITNSLRLKLAPMDEVTQLEYQMTMPPIFNPGGGLYFPYSRKLSQQQYERGDVIVVADLRFSNR